MKNYKRILLFAVSLILLGLFLAACGGDGESEDTPSEDTTTEEATDTPPPPTDTPIPPTDTPIPPTDTPVPPTDTPAPTPTPDITADFATYENSELGIVIKHPADWAVVEFGILFIGTDEDLFGSDTFEEGAATIFIGGSLEDLEVSDPIAGFEEAAAEFTQDGLEITSGPDPITINGQEAAIATVAGSIDAGSEVTGIIVLIIGEEAGGIFIALTPTASYDEYGPIFEAMANSIELSLPETAEFDTGPEIATGFLLYGDSVEDAIEDAAGDAWEFIAAEGEIIDILVEPFGELDVVIDLVNSSGESVVGGEIDLEFGTERIIEFEIPATDTYTLKIRGFGEQTGDYALTLAESGAAVSDSSDLPLYVTSTIEGEDVTLVPFNALAGDIVDITVTPLNDTLDVIVDVWDVDSQSLLENPSDYSLDTEIVPLVFMPEDGVYYVAVSGYDGSTGDFEVDVELSNNGQLNTIVFATDTVEEADETHIFPFFGRSGDPVSTLVDPLESEFDIVLSVHEFNTDELLDEVDFSTGTETMAFIIPEEGDYYFQVSGYEGSLGTYDIMLMGPATVAFELAIGDDVIGQFDDNNFIEYYLGQDAGDTVTITAEPFGETDVVIIIYDFDFNILAQKDDNFGGEDEVLEYTFESDDLIIIEISDYNESQGSFSLKIE